MSETTDYTLTAYKGPEFQQKLMWQLLVEPEYAEKTIPNLSVEYFDDPNLKRLFLIMLEYLRTYEKVPNLQNQSIHQAINEFKTPHNIIEEESLFAAVKRIELFNERILNQSLMHDGVPVQKSTNEFIKQQEYRKFAEGVLLKVKNGEIKNKNTITEFEEKLQKIAIIGVDEDCGSDVVDGLEKALRREFRQTLPTGVAVIDELTDGGLGMGEFGLILTPSGVGKTTLLTKIANTARANNKNVLQIIFEDTKEQIQRKHVTIWTDIPLSQLDERHDEALEKSRKYIEALGPGKLTIKKFSQEDTTMRDIKDFILREQKKWGFKYDIIVLDYLDCLESHKRTSDRNEAELVIVKAFEALAGDLNIPCWSAIQSNRSGFDSELVEAYQTGGSIKRVQKAHFFMSVAKTPDQKEAGLASIRIIKARFAQDGQTFKDCIFNNDTMQIIIKDDRYVGNRYKNLKKYTDEDINKLEGKASVVNLIHVAASNAMDENESKISILSDLEKSYLNNNPNEKVIIEKTKTENEGITEGLNEGAIGGAVGGPNEPKDQPEYTVIEGTGDILEMDEDIPIEKIDGVSDAVNDGVNDGVETEIFDWNGESGSTTNEVTNEIEVKIEDIKVADGTLTDVKAGDVLKRPESGPTYLPAGIYTRNENNDIVVLGVAKESKIEEKIIDKTINEEKNTKFFISENDFEDPDAPSNSHKGVYDILSKMAKSQKVKADD